MSLRVWVVTANRDPLATSLAKFQRKAHNELCYEIIARMEQETLGAVYHTPGHGWTKPNGEPWELASFEEEYYISPSLSCNSQCNRKDHQRYDCY